MDIQILFGIIFIIFGKAINQKKRLLFYKGALIRYDIRKTFQTKSFISDNSLYYPGATLLGIIATGIIRPVLHLGQRVMSIPVRRNII